MIAKVPSSPADLRILLVGKTGAGKSAAGNTILGGKKCFESRPSPESVTKRCRTEVVILEGKTISVTDTPGVYDTDFTDEVLRHELDSCINMTVPGPHVFLLVLSAGVRYNRDEKGAVQWICDNFGKDTLHYAIVLFTHTDQLYGTPLEQYVDKSANLRKLISDCGSRFHGWNNKDENPHQVTQLLQKIERMVESNIESGREYYTNDIYKRAQRKKSLKKAGLVVAEGVAGVGVATAVTGGIVLGVIGAPVASIAIGVGSLAALGGGGVVFLNKISENREM